MTNIKKLHDSVNQMILAGKALEAFEEYYAEDVRMQENAAPPTVGKAANREREKAFFGSIEKVYKIELGDSAAQGNVSFSEWLFDVDFKGAGHRQMRQVSRREWRDGKVVDERFYYSAA